MGQLLVSGKLEVDKKTPARKAIGTRLHVKFLLCANRKHGLEMGVQFLQRIVPKRLFRPSAYTFRLPFIPFTTELVMWFHICLSDMANDAPLKVRMCAPEEIIMKGVQGWYNNAIPFSLFYSFLVFQCYQLVDTGNNVSGTSPRPLSKYNRDKCWNKTSALMLALG